MPSSLLSATVRCLIGSAVLSCNFLGFMYKQASHQKHTYLRQSIYFPTTVHALSFNGETKQRAKPLRTQCLHLTSYIKVKNSFYVVDEADLYALQNHFHLITGVSISSCLFHKCPFVGMHMHQKACHTQQI